MSLYIINYNSIHDFSRSVSYSIQVKNQNVAQYAIERIAYIF